MKAFLMNVAFWLKWIMIAPDGSFVNKIFFFFFSPCQWDSVSKCRVSPVLTNRTMFIFSRDAKSWLFIAFCTSTNALVNCHILVQCSKQFVGWEPEGRYPCSTMFCWKPEGRYHHRLCTTIAPFWLSTDQFIMELWNHHHHTSRVFLVLTINNFFFISMHLQGAEP